MVEYPHEPGGDSAKYKASWIFPIICMPVAPSRHYLDTNYEKVCCALAVSVPLIIVAFNVNQLMMIPYNYSQLRSNSKNQPGPSSVRPLTEEVIASSASIGSVSMNPFSKSNRAAKKRFSHVSAKYPISSFYDRFTGKLQSRNSYRQADDCESGNNQSGAMFSDGYGEAESYYKRG